MRAAMHERKVEDFRRVVRIVRLSGSKDFVDRVYTRPCHSGSIASL